MTEVFRYLVKLILVMLALSFQISFATDSTSVVPNTMPAATLCSKKFTAKIGYVPSLTQWAGIQVNRASYYSAPAPNTFFIDPVADNTALGWVGATPNMCPGTYTVTLHLELIGLTGCGGNWCCLNARVTTATGAVIVAPTGGCASGSVFGPVGGSIMTINGTGSWNPTSGALLPPEITGGTTLDFGAIISGNSTITIQ